MSSPARPPTSRGRGLRLQRVLAAAGHGSRRQCEELILAGRVSVDRQIVTELGTRVDPDRQEVRVDGVLARLPERKYFLLHKPVGIVCTARDPWARTRVIDLVADPDRLFTVGRLDKNSSGLILVTNDGDLANQLTHPRFGVPKVYRVTVMGKPSAGVLRQLRAGVHLAEGKARVDAVRLRQAHPRKSVLEITLTEGMNREIRRIMARLGHKVLQLKRVGLGPLRLGQLPVGAYRELEPRELKAVRKAASPSRSHRGQARSSGSGRSGGGPKGGRPKQQPVGKGSRARRRRVTPRKSN